MNFPEHIFITFVNTMSTQTLYNPDGNFFRKLINTFLSIVKIVLRSKFNSKLPEAKEISCVVLGNGPSLKQSLEKHVDFIKQHAIICVNSFSLANEFEELKPSRYVLLDSGFWLSDKDFVWDVLNAIKSKTIWELVLLIPQMAMPYKERFEVLKNENPNIHIHYFNYTVFKGFEKIGYFLYSKNLAMPQSQNVLVASLFLAINTHFKKIYIFGSDHTWHENLHVDENNVLSTKHIHFYNHSEQVSYVPFYKGAHLKETFSVHEIFYTWAKVFYGYFAINSYAKYKNCEIVNVSEVSFIDAFKRLKL